MIMQCTTALGIGQINIKFYLCIPKYMHLSAVYQNTLGSWHTKIYASPAVYQKFFFLNIYQNLHGFSSYAKILFSFSKFENISNLYTKIIAFQHHIPKFLLSCLHTKICTSGFYIPKFFFYIPKLIVRLIAAHRTAIMSIGHRRRLLLRNQTYSPVIIIRHGAMHRSRIPPFEI